MNPKSPLEPSSKIIADSFSSALLHFQYSPYREETGIVKTSGNGVVLIDGLPNAFYEERIIFSDGSEGMILDLGHSLAGAVLLSTKNNVNSGTIVKRTKEPLSIITGEGLLGRVINPLGEPMDNLGKVVYSAKRPIESPAPEIMDRAPVAEPLVTGIKMIDALLPIGKGQRELILGDRQTGKTAIAVDTILNQKNRDVICIYCSIGQKAAATVGVINRLQENHALEHTITIVARSDDPPGMQYICPYAATTIGEYFMEKGKDVLIVYDDLTRHARAYREISLLLRHPPGREAFPGDIFFIHSRLLERATHLHANKGGGSLTALPIVETEEQNLAAYIPTNIISITDGQIYLSPILKQKGLLPAIEPGKSVSRVGGKTQLKAYRSVAGDIRLFYSQFEELEIFSRFGTRLDENTQKTLERGRKIREVLKQKESDPMEPAEQLVILLLTAKGILDELPDEQISILERNIVPAVLKRFHWFEDKVNDNKTLTLEDINSICEYVRELLQWDHSKN